jgi:hypothetical protein
MTRTIKNAAEELEVCCENRDRKPTADLASKPIDSYQRSPRDIAVVEDRLVQGCRRGGSSSYRPRLF